MSVNQEAAIAQFVGAPVYSGANLAVNLDLYVSTAGNDNNPGTQALPFLTITRAKTEVFKYPFLDQIRIFFLTAGSFAMPDWEGSRFIGNENRAGKLCFIANENTRTSLNGPSAVQAASTVNILNTLALGGTNNFRTRWVVIRDSLGAVRDERMITTNTATTITPAAPFSVAPGITDTYEIVEPGVNLTNTNSNGLISNFKGGEIVTAPFQPNQLTGVFFVNIKASYRITLYNSSCYVKEYDATIGPFLDPGTPSTFLAASINGYFAGANTLSFLGQTLDDRQWRGAGASIAVATGRLDIPNNPAGYIRGYFCAGQIFSTQGAYAFEMGTIIITGGAIFTAAGASPLIDLRASGTLYFITDGASSLRTLLSSPTATIGVRLAAEDKSLVVLNNLDIRITAGDCIQNLSPWTNCQCVNALLTGATLAGNGFVTKNGGTIQHIGAPVLTGAGGGNFDNLLADPVPVGNANAFFAAANTAMTSLLGSWIRRPT